MPGNFLRSSLLLCHAGTDVTSRDDEVEPLQTNRQKLLVRSQMCLVWDHAHQPLPAFGKGARSRRCNQQRELQGEAVTCILCDIVEVQNHTPFCTNKSLEQMKFTDLVFQISNIWLTE